MIDVTRMKEKYDPTILEAFLSLVLLFFSSVTHAFHWPVKGKAGRPLKGADRITLNRSEHEINTQEHGTNTWPSSDRALSTRSLFPPETWDHFPL